MKHAFVALLAVLLVGAGSSGDTVRYVPRRFVDCNAAATFATAHPTIGLYEYRLSAHFVHATVTHAPSLGYRGDGRIGYTFVPGSTVMVLPRWTWPNMTASEVQGLAQFLNELRNHELGHAEIARRSIAGRESRLVVFANSQASAKSQLTSALANQLHTLYDEVLETEKTYDRVTDHGISQTEGPLFGFRGGQDVVFSCG